MKKYRFIIAFILCWLSSAITLFILNSIWPADAEMSVKSLILKTFVMSVVIISILFTIQKKIDK